MLVKLLANLFDDKQLEQKQNVVCFATEFVIPLQNVAQLDC